MSFWKTIAGKYAANDYREIKVDSDGTVFTTFNDNRPSTLIDEAIIGNAAFVVTDHESLGKGGFYTMLLTVPDDSTKLFYVDWSVATHRAGKLRILESVTSVGTPVAHTFENRNRNASAATALTASVVTNTAVSGDPATGLGGTSIYEHYFPEEVAARHPDGGRLILKNNTVYAIKFDADGASTNELSLRLDLAEIAA